MAIMAERNLGAMDRGKQSWEKARAFEGGHQCWGSGGGKSMTCWARIERDISFQLEILKTSLFQNCRANSKAAIAVLMC